MIKMNDKTELFNQIEESVAFIIERTKIKPDVALILGTGLGELAKHIEIESIIPYEHIPHFPVSTVEFHSGKLIFGKLNGKSIVAMQGRFHYYEGYSLHQITFPVRVMKFLGSQTLIISNACGSLNPDIKVKSIMIIEDHINLLGGNPLIGINDDSMGPRFTDMSEPYSRSIIKMLEEIAIEKKIKIHKGVYIAMSGPSLETRAEYRFLRLIGGDVVGMSTVPENIVARQMGMDVVGLSIITDECDPDNLKPVKIEYILENAAAAEYELNLLITNLLSKLN